MWLNELYRRLMGRTSRRIRRRLSRKRMFIRPRLEALEDRTLLSAPAPVTVSQLSESGASQFGGGNSDQTGSQFLGSTFNYSKQAGFGDFSPDSGWFGGAQVNLSINGKVGLDASYDVNGGAVNATYNNITLNQNFLEPTPINPVVYFTPENTNVSYGSGSFSTTSPSVGAGVALDASVNGSLGGKIMVLGATSSGSTSFGGSVNQPLISYNTDGGLEIFGHSLQFVSSSGGGVSISGQVPLPSVTIPVEIEPGVSISVTVAPNSSDTGLQESLDLNAGIVSPAKGLSVDGSTNLGSASQTAPSITLNSSTLQSGGAISATGGSTFATVAVQMGPLVAAALGLPEVGALASTDTINAGPLSASITPVSFTLGPSLTFNQTGTVTPTNQLQYDFYTDSTETTNAFVDVSINGVVQHHVSSVIFNPGVDTVGIGFTGTPITVQPTWTYGMDYTNTVNLDATLQGVLTVGQVSATLTSPVISAFSTTLPLGPVYTQNFDLADATLATVYNNTFSIASQTQKLASFVIGNTYQPTLKVSSHSDGTQNGDGSLRLAVGSANGSGANNSTPQIIHLDAGTYSLQAGNGAMAITGENVIIEGAGAGQTVIDASGTNDSIFDVKSGASLTLEGVTLKNGGTFLFPHKVEGGAVFISGGGTLTVNGCEFLDDKAREGGAIYNNGGTLTVNNSQFGNSNDPSDINFAGDNGGAIFNNGGMMAVNDSTFFGNGASNNGGAIYAQGPGTTSITNSTLVLNTAFNNGGGVYNSSKDTLTITSSMVFNNEAINDGGGVYNSDGTLNITNSTMYFNTAKALGGGLYLIDHSSKPVLINDTIAGQQSGGGIYVTGAASASVYLGNTIVAENGNDITGTVDPSSSNNLIGTGGSGGLTNGKNGNLVSVSNPGLVLSQAFGLFPTVPHLLSGSPAIDAGNNALAVDASGQPLITDERGDSRIVNGAVDIGAAEYQYDLAVKGGFVPETTPGTIVYSYNVFNNGPDSVAGATLSVPLPQGTVFQSATVPTGWTETDPGANKNGTVTFTDTGSLSPGQSTNFTITVQLQNTTVGAALTNTATVTPTTWDTNPQNNSVTLTISDEQEGKAFNKDLLYHFTDANLNATANIFTATVNWGDNSTNNISSDGTGTVSVVADQDGGFDVLGSHTYVEEGNYGPSVVVTGLDGTTYSSGNNAYLLFVVADAPLTAGALTPIPNAAINQPISSPVFPANTVLYNFFSPTSAFINSSPSDFTATVNWGDGTTNTNKDGSGTVSVVGAFPHAGDNVVGLSHTYTQPGTYQISVSVVGPNGLNFSSPNALTFIQGSGDRLFHFTDANPNATASDYTATVQWGDGKTSTITSTPSSAGQIVADPSGGFDVYGSHTYTSIVGWPTPATFSVTVNDAGGSSTSASDANFKVLYDDQLLTAGDLTVPSVTTEGQSISNQVLFHFRDADSNAQTSDYLANVSWGDGTFNNSDDNFKSVRVVANTTIGGFDVVGSHVYTAGSFNFGVWVQDKGDSSSAHPDNGGQVISASSSEPLDIAELPVIPAAGPTFTASANTLSTVQTVATFTDPGGPESDANAYTAIVQWGDGTVTVTNLNGQANYGQASVNSQGQITGLVVSASNVGGIVLGSDDQTFSVNLAHQYAQVGAYSITTTILHGGTNSGSVTTQAVVADQVAATGGFSIAGTAGINTGNQTVATFTDPEGAGPLSDYSASIDWGDGTTSQPDISSGTISFNATTQVFTVSASHTYAHVGASYPITVVIENLNAFPATVGSTATIAPATPTVPTPIVPSNAVYKGQPQGATVGDVTGVNGVDLGAPTLTYYDGTYTLATLPNSGGNSTAPTAAGDYTVVASYAGSTDYKSASNLATFTISPAKISYTIANDTQAYGSPANLAADLPSSFSTGINGETLDLTYSSSGDTNTANVGTYAITGVVSNGTGLASNYNVTLTNGTLAVNPAHISYTLSNDSQSYGSPANLAADLPPTFKTGVNGETLDIAYSSTGDTSTANVGTYAITGTLSNGTGLLSNYSVTLTKGTLTVDPYAFTYRIGNDSQIYGSPANLAHDLAATIATGVNGETLNISYASSGDTASANAGSYAITGTLSNGTGLLSNYNVTLIDGTLTVVKATTVFSTLAVQQITVGTTTTTVAGTLTSNTVAPVGQSISITLNGVTQSATVGTNGNFSVSFTTSGLRAGTYTITYNYAGNNDFTAATRSGSLIVGYGTKLLFDNTKPVHSGAALPVKLAVTDASGADISSPNIAVTGTSLVDAKGNSVPLRSKGNANPNNVFRYDASLGGYIFNLDTTGLAAGTYTLYYTIGNDPIKHSLTFVVD